MHYAKVRKSSLGDSALAARTLDQSPFALSCIAAWLGKAAEVVVFERANSDPFVLEVKLDRMPSRWQRVRAFPFDAFEVDHIPKEHRLALQQVEAVAGKAPADVRIMPSAPSAGTSMSAVIV